MIWYWFNSILIVFFWVISKFEYLSLNFSCLSIKWIYLDNIWINKIWLAKYKCWNPCNNNQWKIYILKNRFVLLQFVNFKINSIRCSILIFIDWLNSCYTLRLTLKAYFWNNCYNWITYLVLYFKRCYI